MPHWTQYWQSRGFSSWEKWRGEHLGSFGYDEKDWFLYKILDPVTAVSKMRGGPYKGWREKFYGDEDLSTFSKILRESNIKNEELFSVIESMMKNFPAQTVLIGLSTEKGIVIIEGMHRGVALALAKERNYPLKSEVFIALAEYPFQFLLDSGKKELKPKI